ncbi:UNVERIFIED_CONTAM: hypothetical protein HDU68_008192 [Siphonaria sp. JEL0065]|nr:hypothetical protein HDU68_008192 [Siphonaria sp. JEL0065]
MAKPRENVLIIARNKHWPYIASYHGQWQSLPVEILEAVTLLNCATPAKNCANGVMGQHFALDPQTLQTLVLVRKLTDEAAALAVSATMTAQDGLPGSSSRAFKKREAAVCKMARAYREDEIIASVCMMQCASALDEVAAKVLKKDPDHIDARYVSFFHEKIPSRTLAKNTTTETLDWLIERRPMTAAYYRSRAMVHGFRQEFPEALRDFKRSIALSKKNPGFSFEQGRAIMEKHQQKQEMQYHPLKNRKRIGYDKKKMMQHQQQLQQHRHDELMEKPEELYDSQVYFLRGAAHHQYAVSLIETAIHRVNQQFAKTPMANEQAVQTPSTAYTANTVMLGKINSYKGSFNQLKSQLTQLAKKSIKDYVHFLSHFSCSLDPFEHNVNSDKLVTPRHPPQQPARMDSAIVLASSVADLSIKTPKEACADFVLSIPSMTIEARGSNHILPGYATAASVMAASNHLKSLPSNSGSGDNSRSAVTTTSKSNANDDEEDPTSIFEDPSIIKDGHFGTYHPLLMETWFAIGLNYMILGDFKTALAWHDHVMALLGAVDGFPVFMTARCMSHSDYWEVLRMVREKLVPGSGKGSYDADVKAAQLIKAANEAGIVVEKVGDKGKQQLSDSEKYMLQIHTKRADTLSVYIQHLIYNTK